MRHRDRVIGALNLFRGQPGELAEPDRRAAQALADVATIGIMQHRTVRQTAEVNDQLRHALASRVVIEQAKGILAHYGRAGHGPRVHRAARLRPPPPAAADRPGPSTGRPAATARRHPRCPGPGAPDHP